MSKPNCYSCKHRAEVPGSAHSQCMHPKAQEEQNDLLKLMSMLGGNRGVPDVKSAVKLGVKLNIHGVNNGWASWPHNFDPIWLEACEGHEEK